jgi:hypothetical protein
MELSFEWWVWEWTCGDQQYLQSLARTERAAMAAARFIFSADVDLDMEVECSATSFYSVQHRKQDVDCQHIDQRPTKGERHPQRI